MIILGMDLGPYWAYIVISYAVALLGVLGLVAWVIADHRIQRATLADLERRGYRRRSGAGPAP